MESLLEPRDESACSGDSALSAWRVCASTNERIVRRNERKKGEKERERERGGRKEEERVKSQKPGKLKRSAQESLRLPKEFAYLATFIIRVFGWQSLPHSWLQSHRIVARDS